MSGCNSCILGTGRQAAAHSKYTVLVSRVTAKESVSKGAFASACRSHNHHMWLWVVFSAAASQLGEAQDKNNTFKNVFQHFY